MTCPECDREYHGNHCQCGYQAEQSKAADKPPYYYKPCATPGCAVMIGARVGTAIDPAICKWCQTNTAYNTRPRLATRQQTGSNPLSLAEFGPDLYEAIRAHAAYLQARTHRPAEDCAGLLAQAEAAIAKIDNPDDVRRILAMSGK